MATLSTSFPSMTANASLMLSSSSGTSTLPSRSRRSVIGRRRWRGTSGVGRSMLMSYCSKRSSCAISSASRCPAVVRSAVVAPLRSIRAFVASVVPWMISPISPGPAPARPSTSAMPLSTASPGCPWVVSSFVVICRPSPSSSTTSVKVPPISTARRIGAFGSAIPDSIREPCVAHCTYRTIHQLGISS